MMRCQKADAQYTHPRNNNTCHGHSLRARRIRTACSVRDDSIKFCQKNADRPARVSRNIWHGIGTVSVSQMFRPHEKPREKEEEGCKLANITAPDSMSVSCQSSFHRKRRLQQRGRRLQQAPAGSQLCNIVALNSKFISPKCSDCQKPLLVSGLYHLSRTSRHIFFQPCPPPPHHSVTTRSVITPVIFWKTNCSG